MALSKPSKDIYQKSRHQVRVLKTDLSQLFFLVNILYTFYQISKRATALLPNHYPKLKHYSNISGLDVKSDWPSGYKYYQTWRAFCLRNSSIASGDKSVNRAISGIEKPADSIFRAICRAFSSLPFSSPSPRISWLNLRLFYLI